MNINFNILVTKRSPENLCHTAKTRLYHSEQNYEGSEKELPLSDKTEDFLKQTMCFGSGFFRQEFGFKSVYNPNYDVTTRHRDYVMVDFIFYSRCYSQKYSKFIENNLKLLSKLNLHTKQTCIEMGHLPNKFCPSDHLSLVAKFLWTRTPETNMKGDKSQKKVPTVKTNHSQSMFFSTSNFPPLPQPVQSSLSLSTLFSAVGIMPPLPVGPPVQLLENPPLPPKPAPPVQTYFSQNAILMLPDR